MWRLAGGQKDHFGGRFRSPANQSSSWHQVGVFPRLQAFPPRQATVSCPLTLVSNGTFVAILFDIIYLNALTAVAAEGSRFWLLDRPSCSLQLYVSLIVPTVSFSASILPTMSIPRSSSSPFEVRPRPQNHCYPHLLCSYSRFFFVCRLPAGCVDYGTSLPTSWIWWQRESDWCRFYGARDHTEKNHEKSQPHKSAHRCEIAMGQFLQTMQPPSASQIILFVSFLLLSLLAILACWYWLGHSAWACLC